MNNIAEQFFSLPKDFQILIWVGIFSVAFVCSMFWGTLLRPRKKCSRCPVEEDPHEMFREEEGLICRKCRAEKVAVSIVSECEQCH